MFATEKQIINNILLLLSFTIYLIYLRSHNYYNLPFIQFRTVFSIYLSFDLQINKIQINFLLTCLNLKLLNNILSNKLINE